MEDWTIDRVGRDVTDLTGLHDESDLRVFRRCDRVLVIATVLGAVTATPEQIKTLAWLLEGTEAAETRTEATDGGKESKERATGQGAPI